MDQAGTAPGQSRLPDVKVIAFDVFGTVVDWHSTIQREIDALDLGVSGDEFALKWREGYVPAMQRVMRGELPWTKIDALHRMILDDLIGHYGLQPRFSEQQLRHLNEVWHRLDPWPDSAAGLARLRQRHMVCSLSNGNLSLLADMAKHGGLPWDLILSAEVFHKYKPDPGAYLGVADVFDLEPSQVMLAAAHHSDLAAARACGLRTAYIERPFEFGRKRPKNVSPKPDNDLHARDILHLAELMGC